MGASRRLSIHQAGAIGGKTAASQNEMTEPRKEAFMRIGFIGLGQMGSGMARSLIKAGHEVTVWNRTRDKAEEIGREGARVAAGLSELSGSDVVITMLSDDAAIEALAFGADGLITTMPA